MFRAKQYSLTTCDCEIMQIVSVHILIEVTES